MIEAEADGEFCQQTTPRGAVIISANGLSQEDLEAIDAMSAATERRLGALLNATGPINEADAARLLSLDAFGPKEKP